MKLSSHLIFNDKVNVLYHSFLGNAMVLEKEHLNDYKKLQNGNWDICKETFDMFYKNNFIIDDEIIDEYDLLKPAVEKYKNQLMSGDSISKLLLYVTDSCTLRCTYCYESDERCEGSKVNKKFMSFETAKEAIDCFYDMVCKSNKKLCYINFMGGEPFICKKLIIKCIDYCIDKFKDQKIEFHVNTNAVLTDDEIVIAWKKIVDSGHEVYIDFSIDGIKEINDLTRIYPNGRGTYDDIIKGIKLFIKHKLPKNKMCLLSTLTKHNYKSLNKLIDVAADLGIKLKVQALIYESDMDIDNLDERVNCLIDARKYAETKDVHFYGKWFKLLPHAKDAVINFCGRSGQQVSVNTDGEIFLCTGYMKTFGHIKNWKEVFKSEDYIAHGMRIVGNINKCKNCEIEGMCAGGCAASALVSNGDFFDIDSKECAFRKTMLKKLIETFPELLKAEKVADHTEHTYAPTIKNI